ncbi:MAG: coenzyme F420-0:L-glutamate ligase [Candidatus Paceibacterota bacterium]|jgi:coenzyme F420-0:L-glutamate ligase
MKIKAIKTRIFKDGEDLIKFITKEIPKISDGDILVVTSKIVSLSEGRTAVYTNEKDLEKIIKRESQFAMRTKLVWLTIKDGMVLASAGVDKSNANSKVILLPKDSFNSAMVIRKLLLKYFKIKNLGVIISDSRTLPLRAGIIGIAVGYAGFKGLRSYKGSKDLFGNVLHFSRTDVVDSLATSAVLLMGEGNECQPLAIIKDAPIVFTSRLNKKELHIDPKEDMYQPLFEKTLKIYRQDL